MAYTVAQIINIAKIAQYIAGNDVANGSLFGPRLIPISPRMIYMERVALEWMYDLDASDDTLTKTANYVYALCRGYNLKAQAVSINTSGVVVQAIGQTGYVYNVLYKIVGTDSDAPTAGTSVFTHSDLVNATDVNFVYINKVQYFLGEDFTFNSVSGTITFTGYTFFAGDVIAVPYNQAV
jgi:hypothetical protein